MDSIGNSPDPGSHADGVVVARLHHPNDVTGFTEWDIDFRQLEPGPMRTSVTARPGGELSILAMEMDRAVHQIGCSPASMDTFAIPSMETISSWFGCAVRPNALLDFGKGIAFEAVSLGGFRGLTLSASERAVLRVSRQMRLPAPPELRDTGAQFIGRSGKTMADLARVANKALTEPHGRFGRREQEDIIARLLLAVSDSERFADKSPPRARERALQRALDLMDAAGDTNLTIGEICDGADTSWRTLDRAFSERFGIGPKAYYLRLRLSRVRAELARSREPVRVSDVANAWGFWHMGEFADHYRRMFEELPSTTLRARQRLDPSCA